MTAEKQLNVLIATELQRLTGLLFFEIVSYLRVIAAGHSIKWLQLSKVILRGAVIKRCTFTNPPTEPHVII